jgi:ABC-2 type transport system permease protein
MWSAIRAFTATTFRVIASDRSTLFFTVVLPIGIITIIGTSYGGVGRVRVALVGAEDSTFASELARDLESGEGVEVMTGLDEDDARKDLRRFDLLLAVTLPDDVDQALVDGRVVEFGYLLNETDPDAFAVVGVVQGSLDRLTGPAAAAAVLVDTTAGSADPVTPAEALAIVEGVAEGIAADDAAAGSAGLERTTVGDSGFAEASPFALTAAQNVVLFTFITSLTTATLMVRSRARGIIGRALATPAGAPAVAVGLTASWFLLALAQSALILVVGALAFGVDWGDPLAATLLVVLFAAAGAGAGLLAGAVFGNEERLGAAAAPIGLVLGALGGCMVPSEFFPDSIRTVARAVPHFWALEGWQTVLFDGGSVSDIAQPLGVLAAFAVGFVTLGSVVLRRSLSATGH